MTEGTPEEAAPERPKVERTFPRRVDLRDLDVPDWEFMTSIVELLEPYANPNATAALTIQGADKRGTYTAQDFDAFRAEYEERGEELRNYTIQAYGYGHKGFELCSVHYDGDYGLGMADVNGGDEIRVNGLAARIEQLADAAVERRKARLKGKRPPAEASHMAVVNPKPWNHPWVITVVGGVIVGLILYAILH